MVRKKANRSFKNVGKRVRSDIVTIEAWRVESMADIAWLGGFVWFFEVSAFYDERLSVILVK